MGSAHAWRSLCFCPHPKVGLKGCTRGKCLQRMGSTGDGAEAGLPSSPALVALGHRAAGGSPPSGCSHTARSTSTQQTPMGRNCLRKGGGLGSGLGTTGPPGRRRLLRGASRRRRAEIGVEVGPSTKQGTGSKPRADVCHLLPSTPTGHLSLAFPQLGLTAPPAMGSPAHPMCFPTSLHSRSSSGCPIPSLCHALAISQTQ